MKVSSDFTTICEAYRRQSADSEYESLVSAGNDSSALELLKAEFKRKAPNTKVTDDGGVPLVVWHGTRISKNTDGTFNSFDMSRGFSANFGMHFGGRGSAVHIVSDLGYNDRTEAEKRIRPFFLDIENIVTTADIYAQTNEEIATQMWALLVEMNGSQSLRRELERMYSHLVGCKGTTEAWDRFYELRDNDDVTFDDSKLVSLGNRVLDSLKIDGMRYWNDLEGDEWCFVARRPEQIKLACPTYDDEGVLIPLSHRFDFNNDDIRY